MSNQDTSRQNTNISSDASRLKEMTGILHKHHVITKGITPEGLCRIIEELGPTYIKLGQIMALHSDILPARYCDALMRLTSDVEPMPFEEVEEVLNRSYRGRWQDVFSGIEETPLGSASIAQVHKATLRTGEDVIIKVERKGVYDLMARDIRLLHRAVKLLPPVGNLKNVVDLDMVLDEMWTVAQEEMDFLKEAANMEEFQRNNENITYVRCPHLYREYTTSRVLCMEYIGGWYINDAENLTAHGYDLNEIGAKFVNNYMKQIMDDGFFHADPHPGNVKIEGGQIIWIDMGMMGRLSQHDKTVITQAVQGIAVHDVNEVQRAVLNLGKFWGKPNEQKLHSDINEFLNKYGSASFSTIRLPVVLEELLEIMKNNKVALPHGMTMLARGLTHVEGVLTAISPDINMMEIAAARIRDDQFKKLDWKKESEKIGRNLYRSIYKGSEIPALTTDVLKDLLNERTKVNLKLETSEEFNQVVYSSIRNLVIGLCIAAVLVGSSILCTTDMRPKILGIPFLGFLGYVLSFGSGAYLILRYFIRKMRKK